MKLQLNSLKKAIVSLDATISLTQNPSFESYNDIMQNALRAGVIQNFEFTYELCWKFMKRFLSLQLGSSVVDGVSRAELFRLSAEHQLIDNVDTWRSYHEYRNLTSHIYDEDIAVEVFAASVKFINDAKKLYEILESKND